MVSKLFRFLIGTAALAAVLVGIPVALWWFSGGAPLPTINDPDIGSTLAAGQIPDGAVEWVVTVVVWLGWALLTSIFAYEFVAVGRGQDRDVTGVRQWAKRLAEYTLSLQLATGAVPATAVAAAPVVFSIDAADVIAAGNHDGNVSEPSTGDVLGDYFALQQDGSDPDQMPEETQTIDPPDLEPADLEETESNTVYTVKEGDTLWDIAEQHLGSGDQYRQIWEATDLASLEPDVDPSNPDLIYPGNEFVIPTTGGQPDESPDPASEVVDESAPAEHIGRPDATALAGVDNNPGRWDRPEPTPQSVTETSTEEVTDSTEADTGSDVATEEPGSSLALFASLGGLFAGLAGGAALLVYRSVQRRRRTGLDASTPGQSRRTTLRDRRAAKKRSALRARAGYDIWEIDELERCWNTLRPANAGVSQLWVSRFNRAADQLEGAWTQDPDRADGVPPTPSDDSPWSLENRRRKDGTDVAVWRITRQDIPATADTDVVPLMCGIGGDLFVNLEGVSSISVNSHDPERDAEGVIRAIQHQLVGQPVEWVAIGDINVDNADRRFATARDAERVLAAEIDRHSDTWDAHASLYDGRQAGAVGATKVIVGEANVIAEASMLLSLAAEPAIPVAIISAGRLPAPFALIELFADDDDVMTEATSNRQISLGRCVYMAVEDLAHLNDASHTEWAASGMVDTDTTPDSTDDLAYEPAGDPEPRSSWEPPADQSAFSLATVGPGDLGSEPTRLQFQPVSVGDSPIVLDPDPAPTNTSLSNGHDPDPGGSPAAQDSTMLTEQWADTTDDVDPDDWLASTEPASKFVDMDRVDDEEPEDDLSWAMALTEEAASDIFARTRDEIEAELDQAQQLAAPLDEIDSEPDDSTEDAGDSPPEGSSDSAGDPMGGQLFTAADIEPTGEFGPTGLRIEFCGPIRVLHASDGGVADLGVNGVLTDQKRSLLAYLSLRTVLYDGATIGKALEEFWPESFASTSTPAGKKVWRAVGDARKALEPICGADTTVIESAEGVGNYQTVGIATDLDELTSALRTTQGSGVDPQRRAEAIETIIGLIRGPELGCKPDRGLTKNWLWLSELEPALQNLIRKTITALIDHASNTDADTARRCLEAADRVYSGHMADLATAWVEFHCQAGDYEVAARVVKRHEAATQTSGSRPARRLEELRTGQEPKAS